MLTVVFTSDAAAPFLEEYEMLFRPFMQEDKIAFCRWNCGGTDFRSAVPELRSIVRGHERWRALVVQPLPEQPDDQTGKPEYPCTWENPFDFLCNSDPDAGRQVEESPVPLIRLAQMLGGVPEPVLDYADDLIPDEEAAGGPEGGKSPRLKRNTVLIPSARQLEEQRAKWVRLEEKYRFLCDKPSELWLLAARPMDPVRLRERLPASPEASPPAPVRGFALRNRYPVRARFLTMDCAVPDHARCREDEFTFWMMVLTLALNRYEGGRLEPEKLYRLKGEVDTQQLQRLFSHYYNRMQRIKKDVDRRTSLLKSRMEQKREQEELPDCKFAISVKYQEEKIEGLTVQPDQIGLAGNCPVPELAWWRVQMDTSRRALAKLLQWPRRALDMACALTRRNAKIEAQNLYRLDKYQLEELETLLHEEEIEILCSDAAGAFPVRLFHLWRSRADQATRTNMGRRMSRKMSIAAGAVSLAVYLVGFVPELVHVMSKGLEGGMALWACCLRLAAVALVGLGTLFYFRMGLLAKIQDYNRVMMRIRGMVHSSCSFFGEYLSRVCGYMRGRSIVDALQNRNVILEEGLHQMEKHRTALAGCCERTKKWIMDFELEILSDDLQGKPEYFNAEIDPEDNDVYDLRVSREGYIRDSQGKKLLVPYPFVSSMEIKREELSQ